MRSRFPAAAAALALALAALSLPVSTSAQDSAGWAVPLAWETLRLPDCPVSIAHAWGETPRSLVVCQRGMVYLLPEDRASNDQEVFLDFRERLKEEIHFEAGLHALAFHPDFARNGRFYLTYSQSDPRRCVLSEMCIAPGWGQGEPLRAVPATERVLLEVPHMLGDHYSGSIAFGPDGCLYWGIGDGGFRDDPKHTAQHPFLLQGKILRLDVDRRTGARAYAIPRDNPFVNDQAYRPEIYAMGFRNPWILSFDPPTGDLWMSDVGQDLHEEVNVVRAGGNYGWAERDGPARLLVRESAPQPDEPYVDPLHSYSRVNGDGICIVGGFVYRGDRLTALQGCYLFGDWGYGKVWALRPDVERARAESVELLHAREGDSEDERFNPTAIFPDRDGEPLILSHTGKIHTLAPKAGN